MTGAPHEHAYDGSRLRQSSQRGLTSTWRGKAHTLLLHLQSSCLSFHMQDLKAMILFSKTSLVGSRHVPEDRVSKHTHRSHAHRPTVCVAKLWLAAHPIPRSCCSPCTAQRVRWLSARAAVLRTAFLSWSMQPRSRPSKEGAECTLVLGI